MYYMFCPEEVKNLASFPRTTSGLEVTSLVGARGVCVPFAIEVNNFKTQSKKALIFPLFSFILQ